MKRIISILFYSFLAITCLAQNLENDIEWEKLIDYVNAKYVQSFCEQRCEEDLSENDKKVYYDKIQKDLNGKELGVALNKQDLENILTSNGFTRAFSKVVEPLQRKYGEEKTGRSLERALDISFLDTGIRKYLEDTRAALQQELKHRYTPGPKESTEGTDASEATKTNESKSSVNVWEVLSLLELLFIAIMFVIMWLRTSGERVKDITYRSGRLEEKFASKKEVEDSMPKRNFLERIDKLETQVRDIKNELISLKSEMPVKQNVEYRKPEPVAPTAPPPPVFAPVYVKNFGEGLFRVADSSEAQYKLELSNELTAKFIFCGDEAKALANSDGTFDFVCELEGSAADAKKIITTAPGLASKQADGKWKVMTKAKISLV